MSDSDKPDLGAYVDAAAQIVGLRIDERYRGSVIANFERAAQIAALAVGEPLPDDLTAAPLFRP
jgi:predicted HD phosphohydrolase